MMILVAYARLQYIPVHSYYMTVNMFLKMIPHHQRERGHSWGEGGGERERGGILFV
jgi:hypothetical protein